MYRVYWVAHTCYAHDSVGRILIIPLYYHITYMYISGKPAHDIHLLNMLPMASKMFYVTNNTQQTISNSMTRF